VTNTPIVLAACLLGMVSFCSNAATLKPELSGLNFLVGTWVAGTGKVAETGGTSTGSSSITVEANGAVLLRRDHTNLFGKDGKPTGSFDQLMTIYQQAGVIHADYFDGDHIIHYNTAVIAPGASVTFVSPAGPGTPAFRLTYQLAKGGLAVSFAMAPPGQTSFHAIATGTLRRAAHG